MNGGCRCDRVRIRVSGAPMMTMACHCNGCQRMSVSAFSLSAMYLVESFDVTQGDPVVGGLHRPDAQHMFCAHGMTWMFTRPGVAPHVVNVQPTMFDDHADFGPFVEKYTNATLPWAVTGAIRSFEEAPPMEMYAGLLTEFASLQGATK